MSDTQFQSAMAKLIRLPEDNRGNDLPEFLAHYDLTDKEQTQLEELSRDNRLTKYGRIMRGARWDGLMRQLKVVPSFINIKLLEDLCLQKFELTASDSKSQWYPIHFMDFLLKDPQARAILEKNAPIYVFDIIKYERAQLLFRKQVLDRESPLQGDTLLQHRCFTILRVNYDVTSIMKKVAEIEGTDLRDHKPDPVAKIFLMIGDLYLPKYRLYEVDDEIGSFLEQLDDLYANGKALPLDLALPKSYSDLADVGLLKEITKH